MPSTSSTILSVNPGVDSELGYWMKPHSSTYATKHVNNEEIFRRIFYQFDEKGRRQCDSYASTNSKHLMFFGCSYTFGEGLIAGDILSCQLGKNLHLPVYNYAKQGFSTSQMYQILKNDDYFENSIPQEGTAFYNFIADHAIRNVGDLQRIVLGGMNGYPLFSLNQENQLKVWWVKNTTIFNFTIKALQRILFLSHTGNYLVPKLSFQLETEESQYKILLALIIESQNLYKSRFNGNFVVVIWPRGKFSQEKHQRFLNDLNRLQIQYIDIPPAPPNLITALHPLDAHPSKDENTWVAQYILKEFKQN